MRPAPATRRSPRPESDLAPGPWQGPAGSGKMSVRGPSRSDHVATGQDGTERHLMTSRTLAATAVITTVLLMDTFTKTTGGPARGAEPPADARARRFVEGHEA